MKSDTFYAVCIIASAEQINLARQGAWDFHHQDSPHFADTVDRMLTVRLSANGNAPPTHYLCARHADKRELERIEAYQQKLVAAGQPRVPVTIYPSISPILA